MKANLTTLTLTCLILFAGAAVAQTPDGETPAEEWLCDEETGAAFGLCNAYCEAMDCHLAHDGDSLTQPQASSQACERVRDRFLNVTGRDVPCKSAVVCPCFDPANWSDLDFGQLWQDFTLGLAGDCAVTDDANGTELKSGSPELDLLGAGVDAEGSMCEVFVIDDTVPALSMPIDPSAVGACRELLQKAAGLL